ncbi:MAG TPA: DUF692 family protein [Nitrospira sp.]|nr:DUF692 family protein [Nitrospira sp.]
MSVDHDFQQRADAVPRLGLGLSVDVYSPDLRDLMSRFDGRAFRPAYLEIFRATTTALKTVRQYLPVEPLAYHGEGLWITQPDFSTAPFLDDELDEVATQLSILGSPWLNHECATKQMGGYSFGTYLPPLYTVQSAGLVADNIALVQERLDRRCRRKDAFGPLFLLEMSPLTYFMAGTISVPEYFRLITERTPCGLVLDIGHLWTLYRYSGACRQSSLEHFLEQFLDEFPMERVIEIHIAGLAVHEAQCDALFPEGDPEWIDAHAARIPALSWTILERVLGHPGLRNVRGVALEVDTKPVELIIEEFDQAFTRLGPAVAHLLRNETRPPHDPIPLRAANDDAERSVIDLRSLEADYVRYAQIASGQRPPAGPLWQAVVEDPSGLARYIQVYLPHEILHWGGELRDMFPDTCKGLTNEGLSLEEFVPWWFGTARRIDRPYDFFLLKIDRLLEFVAERAPSLLSRARHEADALREAYEGASVGGHQLMERS